jgi:phage-related tail fiber protein
MQSRLQLTDEQQDKVFAVLYNFCAIGFRKTTVAAATRPQKTSDKKKKPVARRAHAGSHWERYGQISGATDQAPEAFMPKGGVKANIIVSSETKARQKRRAVNTSAAHSFNGVGTEPIRYILTTGRLHRQLLQAATSQDSSICVHEPSPQTRRHRRNE